MISSKIYFARSCYIVFDISHIFLLLDSSSELNGAGKQSETSPEAIYYISFSSSQLKRCKFGTCRDHENGL